MVSVAMCSQSAWSVLGERRGGRGASRGVAGPHHRAGHAVWVPRHCRRGGEPGTVSLSHHKRPGLRPVWGLEHSPPTIGPPGGVFFLGGGRPGDRTTCSAAVREHCKRPSSAAGHSGRCTQAFGMLRLCFHAAFGQRRSLTWRGSGRVLWASHPVLRTWTCSRTRLASTATST